MLLLFQNTTEYFRYFEAQTTIPCTNMNTVETWDMYDLHFYCDSKISVGSNILFCKLIEIYNFQ